MTTSPSPSTASRYQTTSNPGCCSSTTCREVVGKTGTPDRLRHLQLRCVHRADGRRVGQELRRARRPGGRRRDHHDRGPRRTASGTRCSRPSTTEHALQCGYCTPGMIMAAADLLRDNPHPTEQEIRDGLEGNLCRCTGYENIVRAVQRAAEAGATAHATARPTQRRRPPSSAGPAPARKTPGWSPARRTGPTTSCCPACCTWPSCAARTRTPGSRRWTSARRASMPGVIAAFSGADFAAEQGSLPCAWPVTEDIVIPHPPADGHRRGPLRRRGGGRAWSPGTGTRPPTRVEAVDVDYEPLPPVLDMRTALDEGSPKVHEAGNKSFEWLFGNGDVDAAFRDAPVVVERNYRQQRLIPCAMEPRAVVATLRGRRVHALVGHPDPARAAVHAGPGHRHPGAEHPGHRARRGRRLRLQAPGHRRGSARGAGRAQARQAGQVDRVPQRGQHDRAPRPGPVAADQDRGRPRRPAPRPGRRPAGRHGRLPDAGHARRPAARRVHVQRHLQDGRATRSGAPACSPPRCRPTPTAAPGRPEATFAIERIMDELAAELGMDPLELRERNWIKHEEFPYTTIAGLTYDAGNYEAATARAKELFGYDELRRSRRRGAPGATRSSSASASPPSPRCAGWRRPGCSARCPTGPAAGRTPRSGCCRPARSRW